MSKAKISRRRILTGTLAPAGLSLSCSRAAGPAWESDRWRLEVTAHGAITKFAHKPSGVVLLQGAPDAPAWEIRGPWGTETSAGAEVSRDTITTAAGKGLRFRYQKSGRTVVTEVVHAVKHGGVEFRISIEGRGDDPVTMVRYPILTAPRALGERPEEDVILLPHFDGGIVENPSKEFRDARTFGLQTYPGPASCQVSAYYNSKAGLYVAALDPEGHGKMVGAAMLDDGRFEFTIPCLLPRVAKQKVEVPYPVVIDSFEGDWYAAAEKYRDWSLQQAWSREPLATSKKVPAWLRGGAVVGEYDPRRANLQQQRKWFEQLRAWCQVPVVPNNRGWEKIGMWGASDYLPPRPSPEEFRASARLVKEVGGRGMIMLSGYRWTIQRPQPDGTVYNNQARFDKEAAPHAQCGEDGKPRFWTPAKPDDYHGTKWARLCRATEFAKRLNVDVARYSVEAGYPVIHWDQENCGAYGASVCYSANHGHPPGDGQWLHKDLDDLYKRFQSELGPLDKELVLSMEESNELYMTYLSMGQQRPFACGKEWPATRVMTQAVPLLMFLHHEHIMGWAAYYPWRTTPEGMLYSLAKGFSAGLTPAVAKSILEYQRKDPDLFKRYIELFQSCMEGYRGYAREALIYGRMMRPLKLELRRATFQFKGVPKQSFPVVLNSVWCTPQGSTMIVMINHTPEEHSCEIDLSAAYGWKAGVEAQWIEAAGKKKLDGPKPKVTVPALSMRAIEFANGKPLYSAA